MIPLFAFRDNSCNPKKCTVKKLERAGMVTIVTSPVKIPKNSLILDPTAVQAISPADRGVPSITALDCSWEVLDTGIVRRFRMRRALPFLVAANPVNFGFHVLGAFPFIYGLWTHNGQLIFLGIVISFVGHLCCWSMGRKER